MRWTTRHGAVASRASMSTTKRSRPTNEASSRRPAGCSSPLLMPIQPTHRSRSCSPAHRDAHRYRCVARRSADHPPGDEDRPGLRCCLRHRVSDRSGEAEGDDVEWIDHRDVQRIVPCSAEEVDLDYVATRREYLHLDACQRWIEVVSECEIEELALSRVDGERWAALDLGCHEFDANRRRRIGLELVIMPPRRILRCCR